MTGHNGVQPPTRIRHMRKAQKMTLKEIASLCGTTPQSVQRIETGNMTVSIEWLYKIAKALQCSPHELLDDCISQRSQEPDKIFLAETHDAYIRMRRNIATEDLPLTLVESVGKLAQLLIELRQGLRTPREVREACAVIVGTVTCLALGIETDQTVRMDGKV